MIANPQPTGEFSVYRFVNGTPEEIRRFVDAVTAMGAVVALTRSPGALLGAVERVIITDGLDLLTFDWRHGNGVVFPTRADCDVDRRRP